MLVHEVTGTPGGSFIVFDFTKSLPAFLGSDEPDEERLPWQANGLDTATALCDQMMRRACGRRAPDAISARG